MGNLIDAFWKSVKKKDEKRIAEQVAPECDEVVVDKLYLPDGHIGHTLNVFRQKGAEGKLPTILDIHGGGWYYGGKEINEYFCRSLTEHGFTVVNISYRLAPETEILGQISDCFAAINHVAEHSEEYGIDLDNFFLVGDSAGGHLVGLIINIIKSAELREYFGVETSVDVKGAGLICPATNPVAIPLPKCLLKYYFNGIFGKGYLKNGRAEKMDFDKILQKDVCPCFFISAYADFLKKETKHAYQTVVENGTRAELCFFDEPMVEGHKLEHVFNVSRWDWEESKKANGAMCDFFKSLIAK